MTIIHPTPTPGDLRRTAHTAWDRRRRRLAAGAAVTTLPYCALKIAWLSGSRIGLDDPSFGTSTTMHLLNLGTLGLDLVALALALVIVTGSRAPMWFVLPTMWVGYGLLGQILLIIGPSVIVQVFRGSSSDRSAPPIDGWVYASVYTGFGGLGLFLLPAFAIHAWQLWGDQNGWGERLSGIRRELPRMPAVFASGVVAALTVRAACADSPAVAASWGIDALIGLVALVAMRMFRTGRPSRLPRAVPLAVTWTASGAWAAWGVYHLVLATIPNDLVADPVASLDIALFATKSLAGMALVCAVPRLAGGLSRR